MTYSFFCLGFLWYFSAHEGGKNIANQEGLLISPSSVTNDLINIENRSIIITTMKMTTKKAITF